jgi:hypothetical protein
VNGNPLDTRVQPHFSPTRQGAQHVLDEQDVVIARGTPVYRRDTGSRDSRIRINRNGYAERALWVSLPVPVSEPGLQREFHLWSHQLDEAMISRIDAALGALAQLLAETSQDRDPNDVVRSLRFWHGGTRVELVVSLPRDPRLTDDQAAAFEKAWDLIDAAVPAGA